MKKACLTRSIVSSLIWFALFHTKINTNFGVDIVVAALAPSSSRRAWTWHIVASAPAAVVVAAATAFGDGIFGSTTASAAATSSGELPMALRPFTSGVLLGPVNVVVSPEKRNGPLSMESIAVLLTRDLTEGSTGQGSYIVTGDLSLELFSDSCRFIDPTKFVNSLQRYQAALKILFDPATSRVELLLNPLTLDPAEGTIFGRYRCRGTLQLPWHPVVSAFESDILWTVDKKSGLIVKQEQKWSKSAALALRETFTPSLFRSTTKAMNVASHRTKPFNEPPDVTRLFDRVNGRRDADYSQEERDEIESWIQ